ncbi:MAG: glycosyltransferase family 2 protein [Candidatus Omnitrophota bacterium]
MYDIAATIVTYKNDIKTLQKTIDSFLNTDLDVMLYIVDNSPSDEIGDICKNGKIKHIFNGKNVGFGAGHNIAIREMVGRTKYFLILNPDVYFDKGVLEKLFSFMEKDKTVGSVMPKVLYPDGSLQYLCRLLPTPSDLVLRKFNNKYLSSLTNLITKYELRFADYTKIMDVPYLSGCFMFVRIDVFEKIGMFDERFFLYFEDIDLSRRIHKLYRTVYYPETVIYHGYERGSDKDIGHFKDIVSSATKYFNKWGYFFDKERKTINNKTLRNLSHVPG